MRRITDEEPVLWGPSIIGFGSKPVREFYGQSNLNLGDIGC